MLEPVSCLVWGHPKQGKTTFALGFPDPLHVFDFDQGVVELTEPCDQEHGEPWREPDMRCRVFEGRHITLHPMVFDTLDPGLVEHRAMLRTWERRYLKMLTGEIPCSTVVVDTDSQWHRLAQVVKTNEALQEAQRKGSKRSEVARPDYGKYNVYREMTILKAKASGVSLVLTERAQEIWAVDDEGRNPSGTGQYRPKGQGDTSALVQLVVRVEKRVDAAGKTEQYGVLEAMRVKGAPRHLEGVAVKNLDYTKLCGLLWPKGGG